MLNVNYQAGTIAISKSGDQNSGRNGEDGRQDIQTADVDVPPTKLQKDQPQCQRTNQNNGHIHVLHPVQTDHRCKSITDRLCHRLQKAPMTPFKRLITGKRQPSGPGRLSEARGGSSRSLEEVAEMEGATLAKRTSKATKSAATAKVTSKGRGKKSK